MQKRFVKPTDPQCAPPLESGAPMPVAGVEVEMSRYYRRRIEDGSIEVVAQQKQLALPAGKKD
jgi:hypothetical protein